jgi:hypothetical protein
MKQITSVVGIVGKACKLSNMSTRYTITTTRKTGCWTIITYPESGSVVEACWLQELPSVVGK